MLHGALPYALPLRFLTQLMLSVIDCKPIIQMRLSSLHRPGPPVPALLREGVSESHVKAYIEQITPVINKGLAVGYRLATGKDPFLTAQVPPTT